MRCCPSQADHVWASLRLQLSRCCSNMALSQGLPFSTTVLHTGPHRWQLLQPYSAMGSSPGATAPAPGCSHGGMSMDCASSRAHQLLHQVCSCRWRCTVPMDSRGNGLLHHGSLLSCKKFLLCAFITSCPSFCTDLGACRVCFSHISYSSLPAAQQFSPFLNLLSQRHTQCQSWLNSGQQWVPFRASWSWLLPMPGLFLELPHL